MAEATVSPLGGTRWDPQQYLRFDDLRERPALDLMGRIPEGDARLVVDLGCGTGSLTRRLAERWPEARVVGVDSSPQMIEEAQRAPSRIEWILGDVASWTPDAPVDVLFSNAALHWLPDHASLLPRLLGTVRPGGALAVQVPQSWPLPSHRLMREVLEGDGRGPLGSDELRASLSQRPVLPAEAYFDLLSPRCARLDVWETEYLQRLTGDDPVFEWVKGTGLRPILNTLQGEALDRFTRAYKAALREAYPPRAGGVTLYPFRRLFFVAVPGEPAPSP